MDISNVLNSLDNLFATRQFDKVENFLKNNYEKAIAEDDVAAQITLLNELMGFYREDTQFDKAVECATKVLAIMNKLGLQGTMDYATTLLNVANAFRAADMHDKSMDCYKQVLEIYDGKLDKTDFMYATLYNNISILHQAMGNYTQAAISLYKALDIVKLYKGADIEMAVTYTNLGATLVKDGKVYEALENLKKAEVIFNKDEQKDYHYSACMDALGEVYYILGKYEESVRCYNIALKEIDATIGKNSIYYEIKKSLKKVYKKLGKADGHDELEDDSIKSIKVKADQDKTNIESVYMLDLCQEYYETYGKPMIQTKFKEYANNIAVGLVGEGSECFGFEDDISKDHDLGPGFCIWLDEKLFEKIGNRLNDEYNKLPNNFKGIKRHNTKQGSWRTGVMTIEGFYKNILNVSHYTPNYSDWESIDEWRLATATNGRIFEDNEGTFTKIRNNLLAYYPDKLWIEKIAMKLAECAQLGQYNYGRMMARGEYVTAKITVGKYMEDVMKLVYLINRKYAPYYKWTHKGMKDIKHLPEIYDILRAIADMPDQREAWKEHIYNGQPNPNDDISMTIEIIAQLIVNKLNELGISDNRESFLQIQAEHIADSMERILDNMSTIKNKINGDMETKEQLIDKLVVLEWQAFDKVQNVGGRAECQDNWTTFSIMRKSQYMTWTKEMIESFINDFEKANAEGRNLITEKYGRMMESTAPEEYEKIRSFFPKLSEERIKIQEQIIDIQVSWMEEFASRYKYMADNARTIHTYEDSLYDTSYETYLRGEIGTYSEKTLLLYANFIVRLAKENRNLAYMTMENTAKLYGFDSLQDAEKYCV